MQLQKAQLEKKYDGVIYAIRLLNNFWNYFAEFPPGF